MKLFVRNLSYDLTDEELKEVFEKVGTVVSAKIIMDRYTDRSKGFGFVEMGSEEEGRKAIEEVNGQDIGGRSIVVDKARDRERR